MPDNREVFTVSQINHSVKELLEGQLVPVWIEGEISNWNPHSSGHCYFSLKDETSQIRAVIWRSCRSSISFQPEDGMKVLAYGSVKVFDRGGTYQFTILNMQPSGAGAMQLAFEQLKKKLAGEGLFDADRKKPLPEDPSVIGVVTSETGAAVRDIVQVLQRRSPSVEIILNPVKVQGEGAASEIAGAIAEFNQYGRPDILIVGRGGGSAEDLWAFNEETVARAIAESAIPVISAVGHEIDFTIADFVADLRAPTPSAAAELAVSDRREQTTSLKIVAGRFIFAFSSYFQEKRDVLEDLNYRLHLYAPDDMIHQHAQHIDEQAYRLDMLMRQNTEKKRARFERLAAVLHGLSPLNTFSRGYSVVRKTDNKKVVRSIKDIQIGDNVDVYIKDGSVRGRIEEKHPDAVPFPNSLVEKVSDSLY